MTRYVCTLHHMEKAHIMKRALPNINTSYAYIIWKEGCIGPLHITKRGPGKYEMCPAYYIIWKEPDIWPEELDVLRQKSIMCAKRAYTWRIELNMVRFLHQTLDSKILTLNSTL